MDFRHLATATTVALHDISITHNLLKSENIESGTQLVFIRHLILELANLSDLAISASALYRKDNDLLESYRNIKHRTEFFKYIRNKYVGHFVPELTSKTFEWQPIVNNLVGDSDLAKQMCVSVFALETAINTFADPKSGNKIFDSETDLNYLPDRNRFLDYLHDSTEHFIKFGSLLANIARSKACLKDFQTDWFNLSIEAGETDFQMLPNKRR